MQMRYARSLDPDERANAMRAAYYAAFDRTVATLPEEKAAQVDLHCSYIDKDHTWVLRSAIGGVIAKVRDPESPPPPERDAEPVAARSGSGSSRREHDKRLLRAVARKLRSLDEINAKALTDLSEAVLAIVKRVEALETNNAIDSEAMATLERIAEQVDAIEQRGFRFVGKYQAPASYSRGDVVNYKGALWNCVADAKVGDRPNTASHKWTLMIAGVQE